MAATAMMMPLLQRKPASPGWVLAETGILLGREVQGEWLPRGLNFALKG